MKNKEKEKEKTNLQRTISNAYQGVLAWCDTINCKLQADVSRSSMNGVAEYYREKQHKPSRVSARNRYSRGYGFD